MSYALGVDLGTTYTAAATYRDGRVEIASLGNRSASIPSVVLLREDEEVLTGEAANRRGATEPGRVGREFKRRVGDTTPIFLGGSPYSAEALMAKLLRWVTSEVSTREGGPADHLAVSHPANWGPYKTDLLEQAVRIADLKAATFLTEPEAAAIHYASQSRVDAGDVVAVYDLGGGTFDAAVLRKTADGFDILGEPEGIERLGGIDFDAAVFAHVARSLDGKLEELDETDAASLAAVARLRQECIEAKEALSSDTDATIPVLLPNVQTDVRITRTEFESMIRPSLTDSIDAIRRALTSAEVEASGVAAVLLVGGSSRIPLVSQLVGAELGQPVAVDTHPKHAIALGAALAAAQAGDMAGAAGAVAAKPGDDSASGADAAPVVAAAAAGAAVAGGVSATSPTPTEAPPPAEPAASQPVADEAARTTVDTPPPVVETPPAAAAPPPAAAAPAGPEPAAMPPPAADPDAAKPKRPIGAIVAGLVVIAGLVAALIFVLGSGGDDEGDVATEGTTEVTEPVDEGSDPTTAPDEGTETTEAPPAGVTVTECDTAGGLEACITDVSVSGDSFVIDFTTNYAPSFDPGSSHYHFFLNPPTTPENAGTQGDGSGTWDVDDSATPYTSENDVLVSIAVAEGASEVCMVAAESGHSFIPGTGNCADITTLL